MKIKSWQIAVSVIAIAFLIVGLFAWQNYEAGRKAQARKEAIEFMRRGDAVMKAMAEDAKNIKIDY